jgi:hypothetical protein
MTGPTGPTGEPCMVLAVVGISWLVSSIALGLAIAAWRRRP